MQLVLMSGWWVVHATDLRSIEKPHELALELEVIHPSDITSKYVTSPRRQDEKATTLFDLYLDEERPFITGGASTSIEEGLEILNAHQEAKLLIQTYCDQRNSTAYGMALSHQRTWQVEEYFQFLEIPNSRVLTVSYGKEDLQCRQQNPDCWEEQVRVRSAFKYLAISQPKLGCLVRLGIIGIPKEFIHASSTDQSKFLQKIKLAPVLKRRRLRQFVYRSPSTSVSPRVSPHQ